MDAQRFFCPQGNEGGKEGVGGDSSRQEVEKALDLGETGRRKDSSGDGGGSGHRSIHHAAATILLRLITKTHCSVRMRQEV